MLPLVLLPQPRQISYQEGAFSLTPGKVITIAGPELLPTAQRLQAALGRAGIGWDIAAGTGSIPPERIGAKLGWDGSGSLGRGGYRLSITPDRITVSGDDGQPETIFHGVCTLIQIIEQSGAGLPCLNIDDSPDFARRGVMLDISRDKAPTLATLFELIDMLAGWKINEVQLYTEHTFAYQAHRTVWEYASPLTAEDILALDRFCRERYVDLVPNQNSFGHMHRWLVHEAYRHLAEVPEGHNWYPFFLSPRPFGLSPAAPESLPFLASLYAELLPNFTSRFFNVGCDETFDLGKGRSKALCEEKGKGRVYLDFLKGIASHVAEHGRTMMFWGDIIQQHPDLVPELPEGVIALEWGYEADHPFDADGARFAAAGVPFYVCPGTSSWLSLVGRTTNALGNLRNAAENGRKHGALGFLNTDWGDWGHWQPLPASYLGFAYGAAVAWSLETNRDVDLPAALSRFAFRDPSAAMGRLACTMGDAYTLLNARDDNGTIMTRALFTPLEKLRAGKAKWYDPANPPDPAQIRAAMAHMESLVAELDGVELQDEWVVPEYRFAAGLWLHGCKRLILAAKPDAFQPALLAAELRALMAAFCENWLARNRLGGLGDSLARMTPMLEEYRGLGGGV